MHGMPEFHMTLDIPALKRCFAACCEAVSGAMSVVEMKALYTVCFLLEVCTIFTAGRICMMKESSMS